MSLGLVAVSYQDAPERVGGEEGGVAGGGPGGPRNGWMGLAGVLTTMRDIEDKLPLALLWLDSDSGEGA